MASREGSTARLLQLCAAYFACYVMTGVLVKYFLSTEAGRPGMTGIQYLTYSLIGGSGVVFPVVIALRWYRIASSGSIRLLGLTLPRELLVIVPSGICTAVVIPTTTLMYTLPITVMVAMTLMRGSIIVASRLVDALLIWQGVLDKRVYWQENVAVLFALGAVGAHIALGASGEGHLDFLSHPVALTIFLSYIVAYAIRLYLMNYYKNTRAAGVPLDSKGFFAIEQFAAVGALSIGAVLVWGAPVWFDSTSPQVVAFRDATENGHGDWGWGVLAGTAFGASAFFSVFLFLFKGRTATFAGLVNRLTSLVAGTVATLVFAGLFGGPMPGREDWIALGFVLFAVVLLTRAERRRSAELRG